ncbi:MAG: dolichol-phosphate mannosyltransferase [Acidobacteriota bacterium]|jgi:dolichol-phosphate mannosyltransferase|nr:dolichol-phosphate mannosyltransferase [Acidobacteriota bacterium]
MKTDKQRERPQFSDIKLGIVCPMANEETSAVGFVNAVLAECVPHGFKSATFFVVLDRVCKDHTRELLEEIAKERTELKVVWSPENRSVVDAYVRGYREALNAGCDWILEIDAGFSHQPSDIPQFFDKMLEGYDCVFGSRFCPGGTISDSSTKRKLISSGGTILANLLLGTKLKDMTSGFEMFRREALLEVLKRGIRSRGPFFQTEIKAYCRHLRIAEVPIQYRAASHNIGNQALKDSFSNLWRLFRLRLQGQL